MPDLKDRAINLMIELCRQNQVHNNPTMDELNACLATLGVLFQIDWADICDSCSGCLEPIATRNPNRQEWQKWRGDEPEKETNL